jgi:hypothetical protein
VQPYWIACVDQAEVGIEEANLLAPAFDVCLQRFAVQQAVDDADVLFHIGEFHGAEAHGATRREACTNAEVNPARCHAVQRGEGIGRRRGDAIGRHKHAGTETDTRSLHGCGTHGDEAVGGNHLCVEEPGVCEAEFLGALRELP